MNIVTVTGRPTLLTNCRACDSDQLLLFLPLGNHPPANMLVRPADRDAPQPAYPLNAQACLGCGMIQVADQIPDGFYQNYLYTPSSAHTMHTHFEELAQVVTDLAKGGLVVDVGCNDGLMLAAANRKGARTFGIDPAANLAHDTAASGVEVEVGFFKHGTAMAIRAARGPAAVIATSNTLNSVDDLHDFMEGVRDLLTDDGWLIVEVPWAAEIVRNNQFDNIYHEHLSEMSLRALVMLAEASGLAVVDAKRLQVHGGSMRVFIRKAAAAAPQSSEVVRMLAEEDATGMRRAETFTAFAERAREIGTKLRAMLTRLRAEGASVAAYGAAAKGNTLLNFFGIGPQDIDFISDRSPLKQGMLSPGMQIPIVDTGEIERRRPDYLLMLAWNFFPEIRAQLGSYEAAGGRFILPLPEPRIVG